MIRSRLLTNIGIRHGYSERTQTREQFLQELGVAGIVQAQQVHGIKIANVGEKDAGTIVQGADGLISTSVPLGVTFADCVPILAVDPNAKIIGTAHAGWKGTLAGIAKELIGSMRGAGAKNIYVSIGPHISMCHYNVLEDRMMAFRKKFGDNEKIIANIQGEWFLDIGYANYQLLLDVGIQKDHIDAPPTCTACQVDRFNSYRADPKERFGVQLGVITL